MVIHGGPDLREAGIRVPLLVVAPRSLINSRGRKSRRATPWRL